MFRMPYPRVIVALIAVALIFALTTDANAQLFRRSVCINGQCYSQPAFPVVKRVVVPIRSVTYSTPIAYSVPVQSSPAVEPMPLMLSNSVGLDLPGKFQHRVKVWRALNKLRWTSPEAREALSNPEIFDYLCDQQNVNIDGVYRGPLLDWIIENPEAFIAFLKEIISLFS